MIRKLWNEFDNLYTALKNKYTDPTEFHAAKAYGYVKEFMKKHHKWGIKSFSCSPVEKKNHMLVSFFFHKTMKDEGKVINPKAAIVELSYNIPSTYDKPKKI
ncbi:hypothetical protein RhiirA4_477528 [Rhizophagus irregularis]|uniref:Uncharacterized protein n=1 Tax=Rhizophagus irregularis TaxID=588596 RepID=A0A2I1HDK5_9GLOM|nr:hypothetical protein RhiirA4_477528 [Rhizophagus irregularis]